MSRRLFGRMAVRDAWRNKWRSLLMIVMVALPVGGIAALDVVVKTADVRHDESIERTIGAADALLQRTSWPVSQAGADYRSWSDQQPEVDPNGQQAQEPPALPVPRPSPAQVLGRDLEQTEVGRGAVTITTDRGSINAQTLSSDWSSPLTEGLTRRVDGRYPTGPDEVAVNQVLADRGFGIGRSLARTDGVTAQVVGIVEDASKRGDPFVFAAPGSRMFSPEGNESSLLVNTAGGIDWADTKKLNAAGWVVASRELIAHPPADSELDPQWTWISQATDDAMLPILALVVVMVLLEVVLLAGPGFAVTARRMQRSLALMSVSGATPRQARRAVMAMAWVMGLAAACLGLGLGVLVGWATLRIAQPHVGDWFAPLQVSPLDLAIVAVFGVVAAWLAAYLPARAAAKLDPVAVLGGRRAEPPAKLRHPLLGLGLLGVGVMLAIQGATQAGGGEMTIAISALIAVIGMVFVVPAALGLVGRLAGRLPLALRYALRDSARNRSRTAPAIAAVAASVVGAVALSISLSSDSRENELRYSPEFPIGAAVLTDRDGGGDLSRAVAVVREEAPEAAPVPIRGIGGNWDVMVLSDEVVMSSWGQLGESLLVSDTLPVFLGTSASDRARADQTLARDGIVLLSEEPARVSEVSLELSKFDDEGEGESVGPGITLTGPAVAVHLDDDAPQAVAVISEATAAREGLTPTSSGVYFGPGEISRDAEAAIDERLGDSAFLSVERGYQQDPYTKIVMFALIAAAAVLMLGGTLTSTLLSLSDARGDLGSLAAVGAAPRARRWVAAGYALVIAGTGSLLGAVVGFIPGVAVSFPLTRRYDGFPGPAYVLEIPWLSITLLVVALPIATAVLMALFTRSRLPLLDRAD